MPGVPRRRTSRSTSSLDLLVAEVDLEDLDALVLRRERHEDLAVEATGAEQRGVEDVGAVRRRHHHDALGRLEAVHLREHLVQRLLALVVPAAEAGTALAADRVDLVDEDDRGGLLLRGLEEVAHACGTDADEHLHEVGARDRDERHAGLTRDCPRDERLAGAGRADEEHTLRDARADLLELARQLQEVDDFGDLFLDRAVAGDVGERGLRFVGGVDLGARPPDVHHRAHLSLRAPAHPYEEADEQDERQQVDEERARPVRRRGLVVPADVVLGEGRDVLVREPVGLSLGRELALPVDLEIALELARDLAARALVVDLVDVVGLHQAEELRVVDARLAATAAGRGLPHEHERHEDGHDDPRHPPRARKTGAGRSDAAAAAGSAAPAGATGLRDGSCVLPLRTGRHMVWRRRVRIGLHSLDLSAIPAEEATRPGIARRCGHLRR